MCLMCRLFRNMRCRWNAGLSMLVSPCSPRTQFSLVIQSHTHTQLHMTIAVDFQKGLHPLSCALHSFYCSAGKYQRRPNLTYMQIKIPEHKVTNKCFPWVFWPVVGHKPSSFLCNTFWLFEIVSLLGWYWLMESWKSSGYKWSYMSY